MKKSTKIYSWAWAVAFVIITGYIVWPSHHDLATDPDKLGAIINLRLPDISEVHHAGTSMDITHYSQKISPRSALQRWSVDVLRIADIGAKTN